MVRAKIFLLARHFQGEPKTTDFKLIFEDLPEIEDGEVLVEAEFFGVDPYMRFYALQQSPGNIMVGIQVARVLESKSPKWQVGDLVVASFGWRTHTIFHADTVTDKLVGLPVVKLPDIGKLPSSVGLGVLGMPGNTAHFGFLEVCKPKEGETVVVSGAAGAVGPIVGQIAKIKGCRVIGFTGSDDKVKWLKKYMGFDAAFNYKTTDLDKALKEAAPKGVDCYFDNVGGDISTTVLNHMNTFGRVSICGTISVFNPSAGILEIPQGPVVQPTVVGKQLRMEGFIVTRWNGRWMEGIMQNLKWIRAGKLKFEETITKGFDHLPVAFIGMLKGQHKGKAVVKA